MGVQNFRFRLENALGPFRKELAVCLALTLGIAAVFGRLYHANFINLDDLEYVQNNPHVRHGFSWQGIIWAFQAYYAANWHPLTWLSHMMDCQFFGLNAGAHHMVNVAFHAANSILVFLLFRTMTRQFWPSAVVAALFALHPLRVESVAWISERKDVLSSFFGLLCLWTYVQYTRSKALNSRNPSIYYILSLLLFAFALMAKSMLVTLPFVLLLLDYWPLGRMTSVADGESRIKESITRLLQLCLEKIPFVALSAGVGVLTMVAHEHAIPSGLPLTVRLANSLISYLKYIRKIIWPNDLSVLYAYPSAISGLGISILLLAGISAVVIQQRRLRPYLAVGWFWFFGMLLPVIGIIQTGTQSMADRYTYLPSIGFTAALVWLAVDLARTKLVVKSLAVLAALSIVGLGIAAWEQAGYWKDSISLFEASLRHDDNPVLYQYFASVLSQQHRYKEAEEHFSRCLELTPDDAYLCFDYANHLVAQGSNTTAILYYQRAIRSKPDWAPPYSGLANQLQAVGRTAEAETNYLTALQLQPDLVPAWLHLAKLFEDSRRLPKAVDCYEKLLRVSPGDGDVQFLLSRVLAEENKTSEAIAHLRLAIKINPLHALALNDLAWILATADPPLRNASEAVDLAQRACHLKPQSAGFLDTLGVAYAADGRYADAISIADKTMEIGKTNSSPEFLAEMERRKTLYLNRQPYRAFTLTERPVKSTLDVAPHN